MITAIAFSRFIGPLPIRCVISEKHTSELEITGNPVESGAEIADHAYIKPKQLVLEVADENAAMLYNAMVRFQESRRPFRLVTGLTVYKNMLIQAIDATRDKTNSTILHATVTLREVIIVSTGSAPASGGPTPTGQPGGANSRTASNPSPESVQSGGTGGSATGTSDRVAQTVQSGDNLTETVPGAQAGSLLSRVFGGSGSSANLPQTGAI